MLVIIIGFDEAGDGETQNSATTRVALQRLRGTLLQELAGP